MSNRTDFDNVADELFDIYNLETGLITDPSGNGLLQRLKLELHNAFVAGQEQSAQAPECEGMEIDEELAHLRAFKQEWARLDGNSPGYNCQKARNYGNQGNMYRRLFEAFKGAAEALSMVSVIKEGTGTKTYLMARDLISTARKLEVELMGEWKEPKFPTMGYGPSPVEELARAQIAANRSGVKLWGKTPIEELTTEQLMKEIDRREGRGPYEDLHVSVVVTGRRPSGHRTVLVDWEHGDIEPDSYSCSTGSGPEEPSYISFKAQRKKKCV